MGTVVIDEKLFKELVYQEAKRMRMEEKTHCVSIIEAIEILGCSERSLRNYAKQGKINPGGKRGTYTKASVLKFANR